MGTSVYTTQVSELSADLNELIRKHVNRDVTVMEIVRQLATESCVLLQEHGATETSAGARVMLNLSGVVVQVAATLPQTVDETDDIPAHRAEQRTWGWLNSILGGAVVTFWGETDDHRRLARALLDEAVVILTEDEFRRPADKEALSLVKKAVEKLRETEDEAILRDLAPDSVLAAPAGAGPEAAP
jgi:hypothetical protein